MKRISKKSSLKSKNHLIRYITPERLFIVTMLIMFASSKFTHLLADAGGGDPGSLHNNLSEFRELLIYYVLLVYVLELALPRQCISLRSDETGPC